MSFTRALQTPCVISIRTERRARHHGAGDLAGRHAVAFAALGDLWLMPIGGRERLTNDRLSRCIRRGRRMADRSPLVGSRWHDGPLGTRPRERRRPQGRGGGDQGAWAPRGTEIAYITREGAIASPAGARRFTVDTRSRPADLGAGRMIAITTLQPYPAASARAQSAADGPHGGAARRPIRGAHSIGTRDTMGRCGRATARRWRS